MSNLRLGLTSWLEVETALPVAWMDARDGDETVERTGIGDVPVLLTWSRGTADWSLGLSGGAYLPVGELGSDALPATATFSTGTVDPTLGATLVGPRLLGRLGWQLSSTARLVVAEQDDGRRLGSSVTTSLGVDHTLGDRFVGQIQFTHFHRAEDSGPTMGDTGGHWLYLQPQVVGSVFTSPQQAVQALVGLRIPLHQDVAGRQLVDSTSMTFGLAYTWNR